MQRAEPDIILRDSYDDRADHAPGIKQRFASDPLSSVWVGASAGTGKTKVLTDRVLRLLLPRDDGAPGTPAHRILCLTFTKAAANEMALRINRTLGEWAVMQVFKDNPEQPCLVDALTDLIGGAPHEGQIEAAQRLFVDVLETPGGLQIMTIHSFCQSVLGRFPLEADLQPNFTVLEDAEAGALMREAQGHVLLKAREQSSGPLGTALQRLAGYVDEERFTELVRGVSSERYQLRSVFRRFWDENGVYARVCEIYGIQPGQDWDLMLEGACQDDAFDQAGIRRAAEIFSASKSKTEREFSGNILQWLQSLLGDRVANYASYRGVFLKSDGDVRVGNFPTKSTAEAYPEIVDILRTESARLYALDQEKKRIQSALLTRDLLLLGKEILAAYDDLKVQRGVLDFDDLIIRTLYLLRGETESLERAGEVSGQVSGSSWIMYKMDQGLDHVLIDEAQDTNPEQWKIIGTLCEEFFSGIGARDNISRSVFTVGDVKQSIYSFQRAAPEEFQRMRGVFRERIDTAGLFLRDVSLYTSFRSTKSVLALVDSVFSDDSLQQALGGAYDRHVSFRSLQGGRVELWPLFESEKAEKADLWSISNERTSTQSGAAQLADYIAAKIRGWLDDGEILEAYDRPIQPGDIMILVRSRNAFVDHLVRGLKLLSIPVSGVDRMVLSDQLAVQDLLALARFCLLPEDDLTLACVLKSPFIGLDEEQLFEVSYGRVGYLWQSLGRQEGAAFTTAFSYLQEVMLQSRRLGVYEFFSYLLQTPCPGDARSGLRALRGRLGDDVLDPVDELLNAALSFSQKSVDSLQMFVAAQEHEKVEIKRELEEAGGRVRIMTVHGSKGLQAPIVIMPDTILSSSSKKPNRLIWPDKTGADVPLWSARKDDDPQEFSVLYQKLVMQQDQEYNRLLYVAMTRAADRLYVAGYKGSKSAMDHSWYMLVKAGFERMDGVQALEDGILRYENVQEGLADRKKTVAVQSVEEDAVPGWLFEKAGAEPMPPRPLVPSRPSEEAQAEPSALSPLDAGRDYRFRRGAVTHKLLQFLPDFDDSKRESAARAFVEAQGRDLPESVRGEIVQEVLKILWAEEFKGFFASGSIAEVPVTCLMDDGQIVSGQIDRLVMGPEDVWIVDYKTNRPPPREVSGVPEVYKKQMKAYRDAILKIYPGRTIHCALLWTDGPFLTVL